MERRHSVWSKRCSGDTGTALVEMAFVIGPLCLLLFGIIVFGYLMSFRQNLVQAAAEGARAGAVAAQSTDIQADATAAAEQSISGFHACGNGLTCDVSVPSTGCPNAPSVKCVIVHLTYDYANHPLLPQVPIISAFMPNTIEATSIAEVNYP